jgi:hypothetical protein
MSDVKEILGRSQEADGGENSRPSPLYVSDTHPSCRHLPGCLGHYDNLLCLGIVDRAECSSSWPQVLGTGGNNSLQIIVVGGVVLAEDASKGRQAKKTGEMAMCG